MRTLRWLSLAAVSAAFVLFVVLPARAQSPGVNLVQLVAEVNSLTSKVQSLQNTVTTLQNTVASQAVTIAALKAKTAPLSVQNGVGAGTELYFTGVNVHIVNGLGATSGNPSDPLIEDFGDHPTTNGLGNLIIGYNLSRTFNNPIGFDLRTGSHNLILGDANDYSSYGGIIGGFGNSISGSYASIISGAGNTAIGAQSVVIAGADNDASGIGSVVTAGLFNDTSSLETYSEVTAGEFNSTSGAYAAVGGYSNFATGLQSVVTGGQNNTASGARSIAP